jgi:methionyl-tRNA formyltransferase
VGTEAGSTSTRLVLATPHARHDRLEAALRARGLEVLRVRTREELDAARLREYAPRYVFFPHWSWRIPQEIHAGFECVVFHMTDLPYGRGGSPLQNLIVRGHTETRLSALRCVTEVDAGPMYLKRPLSLAGTAEEILARAATLIEAMIVDILATHPVPEPQQGEAVEFKRRTPSEGDLRAVTDLRSLYDHIRMLDGAGYPPAFLEVGNWRLEFTAARPGDGAVEARVRIAPRAEDPHKEKE